MSYDKFKSVKNFYNEEIVSPYANRNASEDYNKQKESEDNFNKNGYLYGKIHQLEKEIKNLRYDIASLFTMLENKTEGNLTPEDARKLYYDFRTNKKHILNRIEDKDKIDNTGQPTI